MDDTRFDAVARMLVTRDSRRALFGVLAASGAAAAVSGSVLGKKKKKK